MDRESSAAGITDEDLAPYRGRWIALLRGKVIAQGGTPKQVNAAAQAGRFKEVPKIMFVPMQESLSFPELFTRVVEEIPDGLPAYLAGGAVRDALLGRPVHDMDFVLFGKVLSVSRRIADRIGAAYYPLDEERQTARLVLIAQDGSRQIIDFSSPRGEDLESDLRARDFTINAMAVDVRRSQELLDPLGGASDLTQRLLRTTTGHSLEDDPVRMLRGIRLSAQFNLRILPETRDLMRKASNHLNRISPERLRDEIFR
ncbi:MAG: CCA tRNA nucleotidyltransferase, partial [Chloroflexi bacterium]